MNRDLYFLPILARAFKAPDRLAALREALELIATMGRTDTHRHGYKQFQRFLLEAYCQQVPRVLIELESNILAAIVPSRATHEVLVPDILPGEYTIRLSTGRVLWSARLHSADLRWSEAFPQAPLRLAADTAETDRLCTREMRLLDGEILVRVYPGVDVGTIGITVDRWRET